MDLVQVPLVDTSSCGFATPRIGYKKVCCCSFSLIPTLTLFGVSCRDHYLYRFIQVHLYGNVCFV